MQKGILAVVEHGPDIRIQIVESGDKARISIEVMTCVVGGWRLAGAVPSFPARVLPTVNDALQRAQQAIERRA